MPPPTVVTTAGYWGSTYWSKGYWGPDYWKQRVPVPVPPPTTFKGSGGIGGGKTLYKEELPPGIWPEEDAKVATMLAGHLRDRHDSMESLSGVQQRKRQGSKEFELKETIHRLKERAQDLERALAEANSKTMLPWKLYEEARVEIRRLQTMAGDRDAELERLRQAVQSQTLSLDQLKVRLGAIESAPLPTITLPSFEQLWPDALAAGLAEAPPFPKESAPFPWLEAIGAALGFIITAMVVPKTWPVTKSIGYSASTVMAMAAVKKLVAPRQ
jgi:hypothetical protein